MGKKKKFYRRKFLNLPGRQAGAYIIAKLITEDHSQKAGPLGPAKNWKSIDGTLTISDCHRQATLEFYSGTYDRDDRTEVTNSLYKARLLRKTVNEFVDAFEEAVKEMNE